MKKSVEEVYKNIREQPGGWVTTKNNTYPVKDGIECGALTVNYPPLKGAGF